MKIMQNDFSELIEYLDNKFFNIDTKFSQIDKRFLDIDKRFSEMDEKFSLIDKRFMEIDKKFIVMDERLSGLDKKFSDMEEKFSQIPNRAYIDNKFADLEGRVFAGFIKGNNMVKRIAEILKEKKILSDAEFNELEQYNAPMLRI